MGAQKEFQTLCLTLTSKMSEILGGYKTANAGTWSVAVEAAKRGPSSNQHCWGLGNKPENYRLLDDFELRSSNAMNNCGTNKTD